MYSEGSEGSWPPLSVGSHPHTLWGRSSGPDGSGRGAGKGRGRRGVMAMTLKQTEPWAASQGLACPALCTTLSPFFFFFGHAALLTAS